MRKKLFLIAICIPLLATAQKYGYTIKGGTGLATQRWQGGSGGRSPVLAHHGALGIDFESEGGNVIYGQLGYHIRGSGERVLRFFDIHGNDFPGGFFGMKFHNIALEAGMKKFFLKQQLKAYYGIGIRTEYTAKKQMQFFYQQYEPFVQKFNYGFNVRVGTEIEFGKFTMGGLEVNVAPDISRQIWVRGVRFIDPRTNMVSPQSEQSIRNLTIEISLYLRFLQIIEYID
ncbi:MAG: hypothetical protein IPM48_04780 [Saprospiraceae bacterium]|nr:hypothetical protein [Saprospiraceae bacterium]